MKVNKVYIFLFLLVLVSGCAKDKGFYDQSLQKVKFDGTIMDYLTSKPGVFDSLLKVVKRTQIDKMLMDSTNITLFAPTNSSFQLAIQNLYNTRRESDKAMEYLSNLEYNHLDTMMSQYLVRGFFSSDSMVTKDGIQLFDFRYNRKMNAKLTTATSSGFMDGGPKIIEYSDTKNSQFNRNWITATTASINIETNNGMIHVLSPSHIFGFNDFVTRFTYIPPPPSLFVT